MAENIYICIFCSIPLIHKVLHFGNWVLITFSQRLLCDGTRVFSQPVFPKVLDTIAH